MFKPFFPSALALVPLALALFSVPARANLVTNGSFEEISAGVCAPLGANCFVTNGPTSTGTSFAIDNDGTVTAWSVGGSGAGSHTLDCLVYSGETTGICGIYFSGPSSTAFEFWQNPGLSPDGGNYVAVDGDSTWSQPLETTVNGLTAGVQYTVSFYQASAQQKGFSGDTTEQWQVMFGADTQTSTTMNTTSQGTVTWNLQQLTFTAGNSSQVLTFLALGSPNSLQPFALLDGVAVDPVSTTPEPTTAALLLAGLLSIPAIRGARRRRL